MQLDSNSLIMQWNTDINGNPVSKHIAREVQQISPTHNLIQLTQIPDEFYPLRIVTEDNVELKEVKYRNDMTETTFCVDYGMGLVHFDSSLSGKFVNINYYGRGVVLISDSRVFHKNGDTIADTWDNIIERSQDALDLIEHAGGLAGAIEIIDQKVEEGTKVADRLENFITETQFYGYTITLSREAFVVKADDNGEVGKTETSSVYTDVVVYQGAKQIVPTLTISNEYGCAFKVEGQRVSLASIDVNLIKVNAVLNIDCGDGLVAKRVLEVTKVFDGVNQYQVSMTNPFYSFQSNSEGYIEEDQSVECSFKVSKANIDYENYTVQIQNLPQGLNYKINKGSVVFTAITGRLLPSSGSCSVVLTIDGQSFNKPFTWNKAKKGQDANSLTLVGNQIIRYEQPDYSDIPLQTKTTVSAKVMGLSGTPTWSFYNGNEWVVLENETALDLTFAHNDATIWADRKEVTIKCELEGFYDELTIVKLANGTNGNDAITVVLTNESHTVAIDDSGYVESSEIENTRTNVLAYKGANSVTPKVTKGKCVGCDVTITGATVQLASLDNSFTSSTAELLVEVDGVIITKVWTISKSKQGLQGQSGQNGKSYILNVTGGSRSVVYSQINQDPRPSLSSTFNGALYEDGVEVLEGVSWYWLANGHFEGTSIDSGFTPTIKKVFDESVINNSISVIATYKGQTLTQEIPLSVTKDAYGLDWVSEWDDTKVDVRGNLILTPKIFAGHYDQENDLITGVAIGQDVLNNGRTIGVVGYQNNIPSFLLDTDGSLQVGNPFGENSTGLYYSDGVFKLKVNELSIEGAKVPTENEIGNMVTTEVNSAKNELQESIDSITNQMTDLDSYVNNALKDGILDNVERNKLETMYDTMALEVDSVNARFQSIINNPFLTNEAIIASLNEAMTNYANTFQVVTDSLNKILESETVSGADVSALNNNITVFKDSSATLNKIMLDSLNSINKVQAQQLVDKAKEEIQAEVSDVNDALTDLENTINTDFKAGLVTSINTANLENHLKQLAKEKADLDAQYSVIYNNTKLSNSIKSKLLQAKSDYDIAHDTLVAKIETSIVDNLMTEAELQEINRLITVYTQKLATYSGVAQESNADIALNSAQAVVEALDQEAIFNKLTNNGEVQGLYLQNGKVYINGEYVNTRNLRAVKDDGTETFKVDSEGNVSIRAKSFILTGDAVTNVATEDYVNGVVEGIVNKNISFTLSNEFQIIPTDATYYPLEEQTFVIQVYGYKGSEETADFTIGEIVSTDAVESVVNNVNHSVTFKVSPNSSLGNSYGYVDIPITCEGRPYNKRWSWSVAKQGDQSPQINITGEQVFRYSNNFTGEPTPRSINLTANVYNTTATGKWQYLQGETWVDCNVTSKTLSLQPTSYTLSTLKRVTVRYVVENVFDTFTVVAVSDGANGNDGQDGINGQDGADGKGIASITEQYYHSTSMTTQTGGNWSTTVPTATRGKFIWTRSVIKYTDSTSTTTTPICVSGSDGTNGNNGTDGTDGIGVTSVDVEYAQNTSTTTAPTSGWTTTSPTWASGKYIWSRTKTTYSNGKTTYTNPACITGQKGDTGNSGADAITIVLTNENHTFSADSSGNVASAQTTTTNIAAYKGANTTSVTIGALPTVTGLTLSKSGSTITIQANTGTSLADTGSFDIPLTIDGKSFTKNFSWTKVRAGATGATGTSAKAVDIIASSQVFKSTDGGTTFSPSTITLTPKLQNLTYSNWQYSTNGGSSWTTVISGSNGLTISNDSLIVSKDSPLYSSSTTSIAFRVNTNDSAYYDVATIVKLYDVADVDFDQIAQDKVDDYDTSLNQLKVFNKLTNNGQTQGIYLQDNKLYINGEYVKANSISGDKISAGVITATNGKSTINLDNGAMNLGNTTDASYLQWTGSDLNIKAKSLSIGATSVATTTDVNNATSGKVDKTQIVSSINQTPESVKINANKIELTGEVVANAINGGSTTINGDKITTGTISADMITSGTFKGTNFEAGGSGTSGNIIVKDSDNTNVFSATKNGVCATNISFVNTINNDGTFYTTATTEMDENGYRYSRTETNSSYSFREGVSILGTAFTSTSQIQRQDGSDTTSTGEISSSKMEISNVTLEKGMNSGRTKITYDGLTISHFPTTYDNPTDTSNLKIEPYNGQFRMRLGGNGSLATNGFSIQGQGDTVLMNVNKNGYLSATRFVPSTIGTNYIGQGTGDGNDYTTYNVKFHTHNGLAFTDNGGSATVVVQGRQGRIMGKNAYYVNSSRCLKSDIRSVISENDVATFEAKEGETLDTNITAETVCDFLEAINVKTYVTDFKQEGATQECFDVEKGNSLTLGYIADEIADHPMFKYIGEVTNDGLYAINSNALTTTLIVGYQQEKRKREQLENKVEELEKRLVKLEKLLLGQD